MEDSGCVEKNFFTKVEILGFFEDSFFVKAENVETTNAQLDNNYSWACHQYGLSGK